MAKGQDSSNKDSGFDAATEAASNYDAALELVEERYYSLSTAANEFNACTEKTKAVHEEVLLLYTVGLNFLGKGAEEYWRIQEENKKIQEENEKNQQEAIEKLQQNAKVKEEIHKKDKELTYAAISYEKLRTESTKSLLSIESKAYQALGNELLKLVEIHKFSIGEFAKAMAEQVKIELTGLSAKAAIWAIYETAMGLKDLAVGLPESAGMHFAAAKEFGLVAGASLAAAAGVEALVPGGSDEESSSSSSSGTSSSQSASSVQAYDSGSTGTTQQVTVNIYNPLSEQNWQKIVEESIVPALNNAAEKNITISVNK